MINAQTAHQNQENYYAELRNKVKSKVMILLEEISASIEFHSCHGFDHLEIMPYGTSRFPSLAELKLAAELFGKILTENGYSIMENDYINNYMKIQW